MYPKHFFERFWKGEQKNELFVCMPFNDSFDKKFEIINRVTKNTNLHRARRVKEGVGTTIITDEILEGIANSKFLLFDLSNDPKYDKKCPNPNVMYELGIAIAMREPSDILVIKDSSEEIEKLPFDVRTIRIHQHPQEIDEEFFKRELEKAIEHQEWHKSKRVKAAAESIDEFGLGLMLETGIRPDEWDHFSFGGFGLDSIPKRTAAHRLMDLGILFFDTGKERNPAEYAYHWTSFGREVMKHLGIKRMTKEEFEKSPLYPEALKLLEEYRRANENALSNKKK
ncbi:MAG: hypothetical protein ABIH65_03620 [Nanoarchaeota archaeon]